MQQKPNQYQKLSFPYKPYPGWGGWGEWRSSARPRGHWPLSDIMIHGERKPILKENEGGGGELGHTEHDFHKVRTGSNGSPTSSLVRSPVCLMGSSACPPPPPEGGSSSIGRASPPCRVLQVRLWRRDTVPERQDRQSPGPEDRPRRERHHRARGPASVFWGAVCPPHPRMRGGG